MKIKRRSNHPSYISSSLLIVVLMLASVFTLSGCSPSAASAPPAQGVSSPSQEDTSATDENTKMDADIASEEATGELAEDIEPTNHNLVMDPAPLTREESTLSPQGYGARGALADQNLSIADMLGYAVEDEYLARGEYLSIIEKFGDQRPYSKIIKSEETHLAYLKEIYLLYGLEFPEDGSADYIVIPDTLLEAAQTGVQAELDNIAMYEIFLSHDLPDNIFDVFSALKGGSDSHLLAFQKQLDRLN